MHRVNAANAEREQTKRIEASLLETIDSQSRIITNLSQEILIKTTQVLKLNDVLKRQFSALQHLD